MLDINFLIKSLQLVLLHAFGQTPYDQRPQLRKLRKKNLLLKIKLSQINDYMKNYAN